MKKLTCFIAMLLASALLAGCTQSSAPQSTLAETSTETATTQPAQTQVAEPTAEVQTNFKLLAPQTSDQGKWSEYWIFDEIEKQVGITFDIETVDSQAWTEKLNLAFAGGDLPDVFVTGLTNNDLVNYGSQGLLIDLTDLLDQYAPNVTAIFDEYPNVEKSLHATDGAIYGLPTIIIVERERSYSRCFINTQWLTNLGLEEPKTIDDLTAVLTAFKEKDANGNGDATDEIPFGGRADGYTPNLVVLTAYGLTGNRIILLDGKVAYAPAEDRYKAYLQTMHDWYAAGLVDTQYFSQTDDQFKAKGTEGLYGLFSYSASWTMMADETLYTQYKGFVPVTSDLNATQIWPASDFSTANMFAITNQAQSPEMLIKWLNWAFSPEGSIANRGGPEYGTVEGLDGGYKWTKNADGLDCWELVYPEGYESFNQFRLQKILPMVLPFADIPETKIAQYITSGDARQVRLTNDIVQNQAPYYTAAFPKVFFTKEENDEITLIQTDLDTFAQQMEAKFIIGDEALDNWGTFIEGLKSRQLERYIELNQAAYDRWNSN